MEPQTPEEARKERAREQFGRAVKARRDMLGLTQNDVANELGVVQTMVSHYENGAHVPEPDGVFGIEKLLKAKPGELSRLFGYVPADVRSLPPTSALEAILSDPALGPREKEGMAALYQSLAHTSQG